MDWINDKVDKKISIPDRVKNRTQRVPNYVIEIPDNLHTDWL